MIAQVVLFSDSQFLLANARILDYPIIYCSDGFTTLSGFLKVDLLHRGAVCSFMHGELTDKDTVKRLSDALDSQTPEHAELLLYKKNS